MSRVRRALICAEGVGLLFLAFAAPAMASGGAEAQVTPSTTAPGGHISVGVICSSGAKAKSATLFTTTIGGGGRAPMTKSGNGFTVPMVVPAGTSPGTYKLPIDCADGSSTAATVIVSPSGLVSTGDGTTSGGPSTALMGAGGGLLIAAAVGGGGLLFARRRRESLSR